MIRISYRNTLSPWLPYTLRHYRNFALHSSSCCIHIQVAAVHSSLSLRIYLFAIWSIVVSIGRLLHVRVFAPHSSLCYTRLSLCYTQVFATHSNLLLRIHSFATLATSATPKSLLHFQAFDTVMRLLQTHSSLWHTFKDLLCAR